MSGTPPSSSAGSAALGVRRLSCVPEGSGHDGWRPRLRDAPRDTTGTVDQLVAHFLPQFTQAGWKIEAGPTSDGTLSVTRFRGTSRVGEPVTGQLVVMALPGTPFVDLLARFLRH